MRLNKKQAAQLYAALKQPLDTAMQARSTRISFLSRIDCSLYGDVRPDTRSGFDFARQQLRDAGNPTISPNEPMRQGSFELERFVDDIVAIVMPADAIYSAVGAPAVQDAIDSLMQLLRIYASRHGHRTAFISAVFDYLKYGHTAIHVDWIPSNPGGFNRSGLRLTTADMYNTFWDVGVAFKDVAHTGVLFGQIEKIGRVQLHTIYTNPDFLDLLPFQTYTNDHFGSVASQTYHKPNHRVFSSEHSYVPMGRPHTVDSIKSIFAKNNTTFIQPNTSNEVEFYTTTIYARILPGQVQGVQAGIYKITLIDDKLALFEFVSDLNSPFPVVCAESDVSRKQTHGEVAGTLNAIMTTFTNLEIETARRAARGGKLVIDKRFTTGLNAQDLEDPAVSILELDLSTMTGAAKLSDAVMPIPPAHRTSQLNEARFIFDSVAGNAFPKSRAGDILNLDRATAAHAMLAASTANAGLLMISSIIDDALASPLREIMQMVLVNNLQTETFVTDNAMQTVDMAGLNSMTYRFTGSQVLNGFERNRALAAVQTLINMLLQTPQIQQNPGIVERLIKTFIDLASAGTFDYNDFKLDLDTSTGVPQ